MLVTNLPISSRGGCARRPVCPELDEWDVRDSGDLTAVRALAGGGGVLTVLYSFPHALGAPGIGSTAWHQVHELGRAGVEVHVVAASIAKPIPSAASVRTTLTIGGRRIPHRAIGRDRALRHHDRAVARLVPRLGADVVHAWPLASTQTLRAAATHGIPGLREVPNTHTEHAYAVVAREAERLGLPPTGEMSHTPDEGHLRTERAEWDAATALLVPSDAVARTFLDRGFDPSRLLRHRYGCAVEEIPSRPDRAGRPFTAVFLGRGVPRKGIHHALQAWTSSAASANGTFIIRAEIEPDYARVLAPLLAHPSVEVRGYTTDPLAALTTADVMLLPSIEEGSALVTYEAQAAGCVPLVSEAAGAMIDSESGLVHRTGDIAALTRHIDELASDPGRLAAMSLAGRARADDLSWSAAARVLAGLYDVAASLSEEPRRVAR